MCLLQVRLMLVPPHKFVRSPCLYYRQQDIKKCDVGVDSNGVMFTEKLIQIHSEVLELNHPETQTRLVLFAFISHTLCEERIKLRTR